MVGHPLEARHGYRPMNTQELVDIAAGGLIEIGAHTVSHPLLPAHSSGFQRHEILNGKSQLERILGVPIDTFAFPTANTIKHRWASFGKRSSYARAQL